MPQNILIDLEMPEDQQRFKLPESVFEKYEKCD